MASFLCCILLISIIYSYLGYYLIRESKGNRKITLYLLCVKFLCCNDLEKTEMPLALWEIHLFFAISNHDHIYLCYNESVTILLLSSLCHFYTNLCMLPMQQKNSLMTAYHFLLRSIRILSQVLRGFCSSLRKFGI